eukprot:15474761-Alexandrium_andersonii.AAC.1
MNRCCVAPSPRSLETRARRLLGKSRAPRALAKSPAEAKTSARPFSTMWSNSTRRTSGSSSAGR